VLGLTIYNDLVMPVKTGIQDVKNEYTGLQILTEYRIKVRYDGRNGNVNLTLALMGIEGVRRNANHCGPQYCPTTSIQAPSGYLPAQLHYH
jgi:hypothetical protein